jgi:manganese/zinc/iron transport system permease protein
MIQAIFETSPAGSGWSIGAWTIALACLSAIPAAIVGTFLSLRRMSLLADAISHAVLPGIAIAFLVSGQVRGLPIMAGAVFAALLTAILSKALGSSGGVDQQAGVGVVFTTLFAIGVMLINIAAENIDLDPGCILYGAIEFVPLDTITIGSFEFPKSLLPLSITALITVIFVVLCFKELKLSSFDSALAAAMGFNPARVDLLLLILTSLITVVSFEAVGSILVIVMLVAPACTALLLTDRLEMALPLSVFFGCLACFLGYFGALYTNTSVAGMIAVAGGGLFMIAWVLSPSHGELAALIGRLRLRLVIATDDLLAAYYKLDDINKALSVSFEDNPHLRSRFWRELARRRAIRKGWLGVSVNSPNHVFQLTNHGREIAISLVRGHRLWESFLHRDFQLGEDHLHEPAEIAEHFLGPDMQAQISSQLDQPEIDPHGKSIPNNRKP